MTINKHSEAIFALDIGTRSVVGIIAYEVDNVYKIVDYVIREHKERSMLDGQIHDVVAVANVIRDVKETLEEKHGPLKKVAVAAAGRSLKTKRTTITQSIAGRPLLTRPDILAMELEGVQLAQQELANETDNEHQTNFYCVGYSVIRYLLDQELIGNLVDQRGKEASAEIISTFLPRVVVDSLISALKRAELEMEALTLEPIAAINVLIPSTMRRLNVALVDIGAGTSDIAITAEGAITAYGMVPYAGDEITDALSQHYLLDFPVAEDVKRKLYNQEHVQFSDVLGFQQDISSINVVKEIQSSIQQLADQICKEIILLNGKSPQAVMLIGGGSLTPTLTKWIAGILDLPENRVGVRGLTTNQQVQLEADSALLGPEAVTPIGIAIAAKQHPVKYVSVTVNDNTIRLFDLRQLNIGDAILASGIKMNKIHGKPGLALSVEVNGKLKYIPGTHGHPPELISNKLKVELDTAIKENDVIEIIPGVDGKDAVAYVREVIEEIETLDININHQLYSLSPTITVNNQTAALDVMLKERDQVQISLPRKLKDILKALDWDVDVLRPQMFRYYLNKEEKWIELNGTQVFINGKLGSLQSTVQNGDQIQLLQPERALMTVKETLPTDLQLPLEVSVTFNDQPVTLQKAAYTLTKNGQSTSLEEIVQDGDHITITATQGNSTLQFHDVFRYVDIEVQQPPKGTKMTLRVNGQSATFETLISYGDVLELKWE
jgi:cell division protein FtsA